MTATPTAKRRARRIAADEAHAWARNLRLKNTVAKFILCDLTQYVDGEGFCFVSIPTIAEDTELSSSTVRSRLAWLESIGVIARSPQWVDEYGHRNSKGVGRRTSDLIRLMIDLDQEGIEQRAAEAKDSSRNTDDSEADPPNVTGSGLEGQTPSESSRPSACPSSRPSNCAEGLISEPEPEPESPPNPLAGVEREDGEGIGENGTVREPEHFAEFWQAYPGHEVMSRYRTLEIFETMTPAEREHARAAASELSALLTKMKRRPRDAHKWLAEKGWNEFPRAKIAAPPSPTQKRMIRHGELASVQAALRIANLRELSVIGTTGGEQTGSDAGFWARPIGPDLLRMAPLERQEKRDWQIVREGEAKFAAWCERLREWVGEPQIEKIWLEPHDPAVHGLPGSDPNFRPRKCAMGLRVPMPWPPSVDGTKVYTSDTGPP